MNHYYKVTGHKKDNLREVLQTAVETYNDNEHRTLKTTPNKAFNNNNLQVAVHSSDIVHNENVYNSVPFKLGENVRMLDEKEAFSKGKNKFSNDIYILLTKRKDTK